jgi:magnesium and cobalt transporter
MVTIEDVLEQIVGDIEDEYDEDDSEDNIIEEKSGQYRIKASTEIEDFNKFFGTEYSDTEYSTVGGLITNKFGYLPEKNEKISFDSFSITILRADSRQIHTLMVFVNLRDIKE